MRTLYVSAVVLVLTAGVASAQHRPALVPQGWSEAAPEVALSRRFVSPNGQSSLTATTRRANPRDLRDDMDAIAFRPGERITYQKRGKSWIAVSGYKGDRIFYRKSNLVCGGKAWHNIELEYPASNKRQMDGIVTRIAHGMTLYNDDCRKRSPGAQN
jgi:serine/threonine-protein kinase